MNSVQEVERSPEAASILDKMPTLDHFSLWCHGFYLFEAASGNNPLEVLCTLTRLCAGEPGTYLLKVRDKHRSAAGVNHMMSWGLSVNKKFRAFDMKMNEDWQTTSAPWTITVTL